MSTNATYLQVIFDLPGPANPEAELKDLLPFLIKNAKLELARNYKVRTLKQSIPNVTDLIPVDAHMLVWLKDEGEKDISKRFEIHHIGLNVHTNEYKGIQVAWAVPLNQKKTETASSTQVEIPDQVRNYFEPAKRRQKTVKYWWQFWK